MVKLLKAFADKADMISHALFLELLGTPRRRHSMGVICGPWAQSPPSVLKHPPFPIGLSLFEQIGINVSRIFPPVPAPPGSVEVPQNPRPAAPRGIPAWRGLLNIPAFSSPLASGVLRGTVFMSFFGHSHGQAREKESLGHLSSDQPFLGIIKSPRPDHLNAAPSKMHRVLGSAFPRTDQAFDSVFTRFVGVRELDSRVRWVAGQLGDDLPRGFGRPCDDYLGWLDARYPRSWQLLQEMIAAERPRPVNRPRIQ
jgi:hypothetical protein